MTHVLTVYNTSSVSLHTVKIVCIEVCEVNFRAREMVSKFCSFLIHMLSSEGFCCCCLCFICGVRLKLRFSFFVYTSPSAPAPFLYLTVFFHWLVFVPLYKFNWAYLCETLPGFCIIFFWSISFYHNHMALLALAIYHLKFNFLFLKLI